MAQPMSKPVAEAPGFIHGVYHTLIMTYTVWFLGMRHTLLIYCACSFMLLRTHLKASGLRSMTFCGITGPRMPPWLYHALRALYAARIQNTLPRLGRVCSLLEIYEVDNSSFVTLCSVEYVTAVYHGRGTATVQVYTKRTTLRRQESHALITG